MKKDQTLRQTVGNNFYILKFAWKLCPMRVLCTGLSYACKRFEYLYFSGFFIKEVLSLLESQSGYREILSFVFFTVGLFFIILLYDGWYENLLKPMTDVKLYQGLYHAVYEKACNAELSCFEDSDFYNRYMMAMADGDKRLTETIDNIFSILTGIVAVAASWYMMMQLDILVLLFAAAPIIGNFVFANFLNRLTYRIYEESVVFRRMADYVNRVVHLADYAKELRMTNIFRVLQREQKKAVEGMTSTMDKYARKNILLGWGHLYFTYTIVYEGVLFYGVFCTLVSKSMSLPGFAALATLMSCVVWTLIDFTQSLLASFRNGLFIQNLRDFLGYEPVIPEDGDGLTPDQDIRTIEFRNVSFSYKKGRPVLKNISFTLSENETCALAGYNGAGKTTLIKLLLRFYDPTEGSILVNGTDIRKYRLKDYRALFSTAFQDGKIFARSIRDNVWMGRPQDGCTDAAIWKALELAGIADTVQKLPKGLDTILTKEFTGEGVVFSGGQCQKIIAARAFARSLSPGSQNAPIQIFDEPSSALDPIAEHDLMESIKQAGHDKMLLLISHRLSSIQDVENIILLKNGRIAEQGRHADLMALNAEYASLYRMQAQKYHQTSFVDCHDPDDALSHLQKGEA